MSIFKRASMETIVLDFDKVQSIDDLKLIIKLQAGLASNFGILKDMKKPRFVIKGKETLDDIIDNIGHLVADK